MGPGIEIRRCRREECETVLDLWRRVETSMAAGGRERDAGAIRFVKTLR